MFLKKFVYQCVALVLALFLFTACEKDELRELQQQLDQLEQELENQRLLIETLSKQNTITDVVMDKDSYTLYFSNGRCITMKIGENPYFSVNEEGYWEINGTLTQIIAHVVPGTTPKFYVGVNGNWWLEGKDTGVKALKPTTPYVTYVVDMGDEVVFTFSDGSTVRIPRTKDLPFFKNPPLPIGCDTLRVLCLGNSYTLDAIAYLHDLTRKSGIDMKRVVVYVAIGASTTLEYWCNKYTSGVNVKLARAAGGLTMQTEGTLKELLNQDWDVVCLQQKCADAIHYETFNPYLRQLINIIKRDCPNQNLAFAWQMVWGYWPGHGGAPYGKERYEAICNTVKEMVQKDGIDIIIPIGTAIENARITSLQTEHCITRDGAHLSFGVGRYIAGCTWFQTILAPVFNKSIVGNPLVCEVTEDEKKNSKFESESVTENNKLDCQLCAFYACIDRFHVTDIHGVPTVKPVSVELGLQKEVRVPYARP